LIADIFGDTTVLDPKWEWQREQDRVKRAGGAAGEEDTDIQNLRHLLKYLFTYLLIAHEHADSVTKYLILTKFPKN